jgi:hypothetical protein
MTANTTAARRILPMERHDTARRKMTFVRFAVDLDQLRYPPSNRLEALSGDRFGEYSIRINRRFASASYGVRTGQWNSKSSIISNRSEGDYRGEVSAAEVSPADNTR